MKTVQISVSTETREALKKLKGGKPWNAFLADLARLDGFTFPIDLDQRIEEARGETPRLDFIGQLLDDHEGAKALTAEAVSGDVDLDAPPVLFLGEEITARINEARGSVRATNFVAGMLDFRQEYLSSAQTATAVIDNISKAWEAPLGMILETEAISAVVEAMKDIERCQRCARVGPVYAEGVARRLLGLKRAEKPGGHVSLSDGEQLDDWGERPAVQDEADEERDAEVDARAELDGVEVGGLEGLLEKDLEP